MNCVRHKVKYTEDFFKVMSHALHVLFRTNRNWKMLGHAQRVSEGATSKALCIYIGCYL